MCRRLASRTASALGVDDEESLRDGLHVTDAAEVALELLELLGQHGLLLLAASGHAAVLDHGLELLHAVNAGTHGNEVGEHAAKPSLVNEGHATTLGLRGDRLLGLLLGANKQNLATLGSLFRKE